MDTEALIAEIDAYCGQAGISPATLGRQAGQGGNFYKRLREGRRSWPETMEKVRQYMRENPPADCANRAAGINQARNAAAVHFALTNRCALCTVNGMSGPIDIKALRTDLGWCQTDLARHLGVDRSTVSRMERRKSRPSGPTLRILEQLKANTPIPDETTIVSRHD